MFPIPESYPLPFRFPEIKNTFLLTPDMADKLEEAVTTIEEISLAATLGVRIIKNPYVPEGKAVWFDGSGKVQLIDLSGSSNEKEQT